MEGHESLWKVFIWCFAFEKVVLILGSTYALVKACLSKNAFATRVVSGILATNVCAGLAMLCLVIMLYL
jgi:hypothetical protein